MRRFSQRSSLVTLNDINITPLLDLAFVLLIIFIITTPLVEQSISLKLSPGGKPDKQLDKSDIRTVEITAEGIYYFNRQRTTLAQIENQLVKDFATNPNLVVWIRADRMGLNKDTMAVMDACQRHGITRFSLRTEPPKR